MNKQNQNGSDNLMQQVNELPKELQPDRDLWLGIEQAISKKPQQSVFEQNHFSQSKPKWQTWTKVAASFAPVALVFGLWLSPQFDLRHDDNIEPMFNPMAASFDIQKRQLLIQVSDQTSVVGNWQESLKELEQAEKALIKALQSQPEDPALMKMLYQVYQQQLELIQKVHKPEFANKFSQI